jgi:uncharacterized repeat protein (TIGR01451 family)
MKKRLFSGFIILSILVSAFWLVSPAYADSSIIYVRPDGDDTECNGTANKPYSDSVKPNCAKKTIQAGIDAVVAGGTVIVADGTYSGNIQIDKNLKLLSQNGREFTTIQGVSGFGALGAITVKNNTTGVQIGDINKGFTIIGIDNGNPGVENAAVYFQGNHSNAIIKGNEIQANGDHGLLTEYHATITGFVIDSNIFSGKTFIGDNPAGYGFNDQFALANVPRQLVVMGGGASGTNTTNITFTNNQIVGIAGGINTSGKEQGNTLVTIDAADSLIQGNTFAGTTTRFATSLRCRRPNTTITGNTFISTGLTPTTGHLFLQNNALDSSLISANSFDKGVYIESPAGGGIGIGINAFVQSAPANSTVRVLGGNYTETNGIQINKALTIQGSGSNSTIVNGSFEVLTNTVTIRGFQIINGTDKVAGEIHGIYISGAQNVVVRDNHLIGTWTGGANNFAGGRGILTSGNVNNLLVENNLIENWVSGLYLNPTNGAIVVRNNDIKNNLAGAGTHGQENVAFRNNNFIGNLEGIGASDVGDTFIVEQNAFSENTDAVKWYSGKSIMAKLNWWSGNKGPTAASNPKGNGQPVSSNVTYAPWLCGGTDTQPTQWGFQPDANAAKCTNLATRLVFTQYPSSAFENIPFAQQPIVRAEDEDGNLAITFDNFVFLDMANNPVGGMLLPGPYYKKAVNGVATFSGLYINKAGQGYTLKVFGLGSSGDFILTEGAAFDVLKQQADLGISLADSPDPVNAGEALSYTVTVSNGGPHAAQGVSVVLQLPAGVAFQSASGNGWSCTQSGGVVTCTRAGLGSGQTAPVITVQVTAPAQAGTITASASVALADSMVDPVVANNQTSATTTVVELPPTGPSYILYLPLVLNNTP